MEAAEPRPGALGAEGKTPGAAAMAAGVARAGLTAAKAAESWPRALGAVKMEPRDAEAAEPRLGALGPEGRTSGAEGMAVDAAGAGLMAAEAGETAVDAAGAGSAAADAAEERGRAGKLAGGVEKAAWGEGTAWAGREASEGKESRAKKFAAESAAVSGAGADEDESVRAGG
jgi:hypothetical protein